MDPQNQKITRGEAKAALLRSGYLLEHRLEALLRSNGYHVEANAAYPDPETGKSRELDLCAMSARKAGPKEFDFAFSVLLIECVNNPQPLALITKDPMLGRLHHYDIRLAGLPVKFYSTNSKGSWESLSDFVRMEKFHHYCKGRVATQFCSFTAKKRQNQSEWMAAHDDAQFDAFRKLSAETEYYMRKHFESWNFGGPEYVNLEFYYPVLVVQGELLEVVPTSRSLRIRMSDHLQFRRSAIVSGEEEVYQIDVVRERFFAKYLRIVENEISKTARILRRRHIEVQKSVDRIVRLAKRLRTPAKIRAAMEF